MPAEDSGEMTLEVGRPPTPVLTGLWVFAPNRDTLGEPPGCWRPGAGHRC